MNLLIEIYTMYRYNMDIKFEWDEQKRLSNISKHGIDFKEAKTSFYDEDALIIYDPDHSNSEDRFVLLGLSIFNKLLTICHCYRKNDEVIRLISARKATSSETKQYFERRGKAI